MDCFATLGLSPGASAGEVRHAYRQRAQELHPDRRPGDETAAAEFRALHDAYVEALARVEQRDRDQRAAPPPATFTIAGRTYLRRAGVVVAWWNEAAGEWQPITSGPLPFAGHLVGRGAGRIARWWRN
jgi:DnaJ domain